MQRAAKSPLSGNVESDPPFLPLEENMARSRSASESSFSVQDVKPVARKRRKRAWMKSRIPKLNGKKFVLLILGMFFVTIVWESFFVEPKDRLIQPDFSDKLLLWVEANPGFGLGVIALTIAGAVVSMVPVGTPLTIGCGFIYRGVYGWKLGLFVATIVSMVGSLLGAVVCFFLGRYLMKETVQRWVRKYPLFDAINVAASEQGLKIMAMLYLTPVLPLGLVSYMCGTTSMNVSSFSLAKVASTPLYLLYTFIGASAHSFIKRGGKNEDGADKFSATEGAKQLEENRFLIIAGIVLSMVMMTLITRYIRKELMKILEQQKKDKLGTSVEDGWRSGDDGDDTGVEIGALTARRRGQKAEQTEV